MKEFKSETEIFADAILEDDVKDKIIRGADNSEVHLTVLEIELIKRIRRLAKRVKALEGV